MDASHGQLPPKILIYGHCLLNIVNFWNYCNACCGVQQQTFKCIVENMESEYREMCQKYIYKKEGTFYYMWWSCKKTREFWKEIHTEIQKKMKIKFPMKLKTMLLGILPTSINVSALGVCIWFGLNRKTPKYQWIRPPIWTYRAKSYYLI